MSQFARPNEDAHVGNFTTQAGGTTDLFNTINEAVANDADYIRSPQSPANEVYVAKLSGVTPPGSTSGHVIRARVSTDVASGGEALDFTVQLRQGYVNEGSQGTLIATMSQNNVQGTNWVDVNYTLSGGEAASISDYNDLYLRFVVTVAE